MYKFKPISLLEKLKIEYCQYNPNPVKDGNDHNDCLIRTLMILFPDVFKTWEDTFDYICAVAKKYGRMPDTQFVTMNIFNEQVNKDDRFSKYICECAYYNFDRDDDINVADVICNSAINKDNLAIMADEHVFAMSNHIIYDMYEKSSFDPMLIKQVESVWRII